MSWLRTVYAELARPEAQRDWFGWASAQMAHALIGVGAPGLASGEDLGPEALGGRGLSISSSLSVGCL